MNPGIGEEAGQTARTLIDALRANPATLTLIVVNLALLVFIFYALARAGEFRDAMMKYEAENQRHVNELLAKCGAPDK